jgi:hypothetical protein
MIFYRAMELFTEGLPEAEVKSLQELQAELGKKYQVELKDHTAFEAIQNALMDFESVRHYPWIGILNHFEVKAGERTFHLFHTGVEYTLHHLDNADSGTEMKTLFTGLRLFGYCDLALDAGHTLVRPRTEADFLTEFLGSVEIKLPDASDFSRNYFVVSDDRNKAETFLSPRFLESVQGIQGLHLETLEKVMTVFFDHGFIEKDALNLAGLLENLSAPAIA